MLIHDDPATIGHLTAAILLVAMLAWLVIGLRMRLSTAASMRLMAANLFLAIGVYAAFTRYELNFFWLQVSLLMPLVGMALFRDGLQKISHQPRNPAEGALLCLAVAMAFLIMPWIGVAPTSKAPNILCIFAMSWIAARNFMDCLRAARSSFGDGTALLIAMPHFGLAIALFIRALLMWVAADMEKVHSLDIVEGAAAFRWAFLILFFAINLSAVGLVLNRLLDRLGALANRDGLTGLWNRRATIELIARENDRRQRTGQPCAVVMMDLDRFKALNDRLGHAGGDAALKHTAKVIGASLRSLDALGRFGGEEFLVVLPMTTLEGGRNTAERMRVALAESPLLWHEQLVPITASFGVATFDPDDDRLERIIQRADEAMYRAKQSGRNRVEVEAPKMSPRGAGVPA